MQTTKQLCQQPSCGSSDCLFETHDTANTVFAFPPSLARHQCQLRHKCSMITRLVCHVSECKRPSLRQRRHLARKRDSEVQKIRHLGLIGPAAQQISNMCIQAGRMAATAELRSSASVTRRGEFLPWRPSGGFHVSSIWIWD